MLRVAVALSLIVLAAPASAGVIFDSLDSATARTAGDELEPMFATFSTGSAAVMGDVSLMLSIPISGLSARYVHRQPRRRRSAFRLVLLSSVRD